MSTVPVYGALRLDELRGEEFQATPRADGPPTAGPPTAGSPSPTMMTTLEPDLNDKGEQEKYPSLARPPKATLIIVGFFLVGWGYYGFLGDTQWDLLTVFYFVSISISTVGYGDVVVTTDNDKLFTMAYITVGLSVIFIIISGAIEGFFSSVEEAHLKRRLLASSPSSVGSPGESLPKDDGDIATKERWKTLYCVATVGGVIALGGTLVCWLEGWTVVTGLYWAFQTTTTVGYGDETLHHNGAKVTVSLYCLVSVVTVGRALAGVAAASEEAHAERHRRRLLRSLSHLLAQAQRGRGVGRAQYLASTLVALGRVSREDVDSLLARFDELDFEKSGELSSALIKRASFDSLNSGSEF